MAKLLQMDFPFAGPFGAELSTALTGLAESIAKEPGLIWKIWTESEPGKLGGGIYLFEDEASAEAYEHKHIERLQAFGIPEIRSLILDVNEELGRITRAPGS